MVPRQDRLTLSQNACNTAKMRKELEEKLKEAHPNILKDMWGDPKKTCMAWGIECADGWYDLLESMLTKIDLASEAFASIGKLVKVEASQVKEKFGTLSFYYDISSSSEIASSIINDIVFRAERASASVCEVTGKHGELCLKGGWYKTLCREKAQEMGYSPVKPEVAQYWASIDEDSVNTAGDPLPK